MAKTVGLSQSHKKMLEFVSFPNDKFIAVLLYAQGEDFYKVFKASFKQGYYTVSKFDIPNFDNLGVNLTNYHFAIELLLKALISLKENKLEEKYRHHEVEKLLKVANQYYSQINVICTNEEYMLLIKELSTKCIKIRYGQGALTLRHNNKIGWENKKPLQELSEALDSIFTILSKAFREAANIPPTSKHTIYICDEGKAKQFDI